MNITSSCTSITTRILAIAIGALCLPSISFAESDITGWQLPINAFKKIRLPASGDIPYLLIDFEYEKSVEPKVIEFDLNGDGQKDYLVAAADSLCGNAGCPIAFVDGATNKRIGDFFGNIIISKEKKNGFPVIQTYAHLSADSGTYVVSEFDGKVYKTKAKTELKGNAASDLVGKMQAQPLLHVSE